MGWNSVLLWPMGLVKVSNGLELRLSFLTTTKGPQQNRDKWEKFGIIVRLGGGNVKDRTRISDFTGESADKLGGFPVNSPDCMVQNESVNNTWKNLVRGLYDKFNKRKPSRQTMGGFYSDINSPFDNLSQKKIRNAIDIQPKVMGAIIAANGKEDKGGLIFVR